MNGVPKFEAVQVICKAAGLDRQRGERLGTVRE
jgi:hypothetical protein